MNIEEIRQLAVLLNENKLTCLEITAEGTTVRLEKSQLFAGTHSEETVNRTDIRLSVSDPGKDAGGPCSKGEAIASPVVGVFYAAASPESEPFVLAGSEVKKGDVLCVIEAMKLMNEIVADRDGIVAQVCAQNGQVVEFGQTLFILR